MDWGKMMAEITLTSDITVRLIQKVGGDEMVVAAARVSTSGEEALKYAAAPAEENAGLIRYLMRNRHGTPFEHSCLTFFVHAPIFVWREWHRHRVGFSFNEESARYKTLDPVFYVAPPGRPSRKVVGWKPGRPEFEVDEALTRRVNARNASVYGLAYEKYLLNLEDGADPGLARDCLPVGIYSSCWVTCNPRSLMAFLSLRTRDETARHAGYPLHEIEVAARACEDIFKAGWPLTHAAWVEFGRVGP
jgi:thymidylate synthase (FAD)